MAIAGAFTRGTWTCSWLSRPLYTPPTASARTRLVSTTARVFQADTISLDDVGRGAAPRVSPARRARTCHHRPACGRPGNSDGVRRRGPLPAARRARPRQDAADQ